MSHQMMGALFPGIHYEVSYQKANEQNASAEAVQTDG